MSYQRAIVNCGRCYEIAHEEIGSNVRWAPGELRRTLNAKELLWQARNDAMQALEDEARNPITEKEKRYEFETSESIIEKIRTALTECLNCEFKKPKIVEIFNPSDGSV